MRRALLLAVMFVGPLSVGVGRANAEPPAHGAELVFPFHAQHNHAPGIVECPNGDLLVSWYRGAGERKADDVAVYGARRKKGEATWSEPFLLADTPGFPDCNTCLFIDKKQRLWVFWPLILANSWESCLTQYRISENYQQAGPPVWAWQGSLSLIPKDFEPRMTSALDAALKKEAQSPRLTKWEAEIRVAIKDKLSQRLGWQPRCKPTQLPSGRIVLPLYSDTYSVSLMALSDDDGATWRASTPLVGFGNIQPAVLRRDNGTLVAYMRENGPLQKIRVCESADEGETWGPVGTIDLPNPGSGLDAVRLANGHWLMLYNDTEDGRNSLAVSISTDEGKTWRLTKHLEHQPTGSYHYPCVIQAADGRVHCVYSFFTDAGKSMKHAEFTEAWVGE